MRMADDDACFLAAGADLGHGVEQDLVLILARNAKLLAEIAFADERVANWLALASGDAVSVRRRLRFVDGEPQPPETIGEGKAFPDGIGVYVPGGSAGASDPSPA